MSDTEAKPSMKLYNKGDRHIHVQNGTFAPKTTGTFEHEEGQKLRRLYKGEVINPEDAVSDFTKAPGESFVHKPGAPPAATARTAAPAPAPAPAVKRAAPAATTPPAAPANGVGTSPGPNTPPLATAGAGAPSK